MSDDNTQDANEPSPASAGSQPVAWAVMQPDSYSVFASRMLAEKMQELCDGGDIVPLYIQPQPALTDEERECLEWAEEIAGNCEEFDRVNTLRSLLERLK